MDERFADWYRIVDPDPRSDTLQNRWAVVEEQAKAADMTLALDLVRLFTGVPQSEVASAAAFVAAFKQADPALPMRENDKLIEVLAGATLLRAFAYKDPVADAAALALRSIRFAGHGRRGVFADLMEVADAYLEQRSREVRTNNEEERTPGSTVAKQFAKIASPELPELPRVGNYQQYGQANSAFTQIESYATAVGASFEALRSAVIQLEKDIAARTSKASLWRSRQWMTAQEELNILWWLFGESSRDLKIPATEIKIDAFAVIAGKELNDLTTSIPGVLAAEAMLHRALRATGSVPSTSLSFKNAIEAVPEDWRRGFIASPEAAPTHLREIAPVHLAVRRSLEDGNAWPTTFRKNAALRRDPKLSALELAGQVYTERLLARAIKAAEA